MRNKFISLFFALLLVFTLPISAYADDFSSRNKGSISVQLIDNSTNTPHRKNRICSAPAPGHTHRPFPGYQRPLPDRRPWPWRFCSHSRGSPRCCNSLPPAHRSAPGPTGRTPAPDPGRCFANTCRFFPQCSYGHRRHTHSPHSWHSLLPPQSFAARPPAPRKPPPIPERAFHNRSGHPSSPALPLPSAQLPAVNQLESPAAPVQCHDDSEKTASN